MFKERLIYVKLNTDALEISKTYESVSFPVVKWEKGLNKWFAQSLTSISMSSGIAKGELKGLSSFQMSKQVNINSIR